MIDHDDEYDHMIHDTNRPLTSDWLASGILAVFALGFPILVITLLARSPS